MQFEAETPFILVMAAPVRIRKRIANTFAFFFMFLLFYKNKYKGVLWHLVLLFLMLLLSDKSRRVSRYKTAGTLLTTNVSGMQED